MFNTPRAISSLQTRRNVGAVELANLQPEIGMYYQKMMYEEIDDDKDPFVVAKNAHDKILARMKEQLLIAVNKRRSKVLPIALDIFNKL